MYTYLNLRAILMHGAEMIAQNGFVALAVKREITSMTILIKCWIKLGFNKKYTHCKGTFTVVKNADVAIYKWLNLLLYILYAD